jgi:hypothetical protein
LRLPCRVSGCDLPCGLAAGVGAHTSAAIMIRTIGTAATDILESMTILSNLGAFYIRPVRAEAPIFRRLNLQFPRGASVVPPADCGGTVD